MRNWPVAILFVTLSLMLAAGAVQGAGPDGRAPAVQAFKGTTATPKGEEGLVGGLTGSPAPVETGIWWNPAEAGWGIDLHVSGESLAAIWYTYTAEGRPIWYTAAAPLAEDDRWEAQLLKHTWDRDEGTSSHEQVGSLTIEFSSARSAELSWRIGERRGATPIEPFVFNPSLSVRDHTGQWFNTQQPGWGLSVNSQGTTDVAVFYFYDDEERPVWVLGRRERSAGDTIAMEAFEGSCPHCEYDEPLTQPAGELFLTFSGEAHGRVRPDVSLPEPWSGAWSTPAPTDIVMLSRRPSQRAHDAALAPFASEAALERYLKHAMASRPPEEPSTDVDFSPAPPSGPVSSTNVQVAGVDEADIVKTDGATMYGALPPIDSEQHRVRIMAMQGAPFGVRERAMVRFGDATDSLIKGLYLASERPADRPDLMAAVVSTQPFSRSNFLSPPSAAFWAGNGRWIDGRTEVHLFDVSDPAAPEQQTTITVGGHLVATRRIGETLYLVTRQQPFVEGLIDDPESQEDVEANLELLADVPLSDLLPALSIDGQDRGSVVASASTFLPPLPDGAVRADLVTLTAVNLAEPTLDPETVTFVGLSETVFASQRAFYLVTSRFDYRGRGTQNPIYPPQTISDVHKIALTDSGPQYRASAGVEGHLGGFPGQMRFRLGEHEGVLGIVTSSRDQWGELGDHRVTLLKEVPATDETGLLAEVAHVPSQDRPKRLGKPDERLYSTRFVGDRLYAVTFLKVDPLYVVDIDDPADPRIRGALEVPGFSSYLHPVGEDYVLGLGKDAVEAESTGDRRFAWFQGLRLGMFDVSDPDNPREVDNAIIGKRGTQSPALFQPHAFTYLAPQPELGQPARVAFPVRLHGRPPGDTEEREVNEHFPWLHTGLHRFAVSTGGQDGPGIHPLTPLVVASREEESEEPQFEHTLSDSSRAVIAGEGIFFYHWGKVWTAPWDAPRSVAGPQ